MEELKNEQTLENVAQAVETEKVEGAENEKVSLGKFRDINSLLSAYNSLQAEFTKRCQRIKELEVAQQSNDKVIAPLEVSEEKENNKPVDTTFNEQEILKDYLKKVMGSKQKAVVLDGEGNGIKTPVSRPTTVEQAGNLANSNALLEKITALETEKNAKLAEVTANKNAEVTAIQAEITALNIRLSGCNTYFNSIFAMDVVAKNKS